jgi:hypothetical protein
MNALAAVLLARSVANAKKALAKSLKKAASSKRVLTKVTR